MEIIEGDKQHIESCRSIAGELPHYFTPSAVEAMARDLLQHRFYVAMEAGGIAGFIAVEHKSAQVSEITWLAVKPEHQRAGIGSLLVDRVVCEAKAVGCRVLEVKTLAADTGHAPYSLTRRFYENRDFLLLETIDSFPGWDPGNPCAIYVRVL